MEGKILWSEIKNDSIEETDFPMTAVFHKDKGECLQATQ